MLKPFTRLFIGIVLLAWAPVLLSESSPADLEFFEKQVRPLLVAKCYECHSQEKKVKGGLRLDIREGWVKGGDTGPAIVPENPGESLLIKAIHWGDPDFQMPPKNKLTSTEIAILEEWVKRGAPDPRIDSSAPVALIDVEKGRSFWAYQLPRKQMLPVISNSSIKTDIDRFIFAKLEQAKLQPAPAASRDTLIRRLYFDLIGIPPSPDQLASSDSIEQIIDNLLASPHFGERWARHWFDIVRFGQSVGLRGFVYKEAWRYRDYMIESFNEDRSLQDLLREHIAGDLLSSDDLKTRQRQLIATTFLVMGNTNFEEQDKKQLDMDVVDEQLDTIGKAFLGQTIGCARCHDHKFDPIPTRDYYAMAGAFRNSIALEHANLSNWIEVPLPVEPELEEGLKAHEEKLAKLQADLKAAKEIARKLSGSKGPNDADKPEVLDPRVLPGIVVDSAQAKRVGEWKHSVHIKRYIGDGYLHDENSGKGEKTLSFAPELPKAGKYEVRFAYSYADSRAAKTPITIFHAEGETVVHVNLKEPPPIDGRFVSLGTFRFENNGFANVLVSTDGTSGFVTADAVQFLPGGVEQPVLVTDNRKLTEANASVKDLESKIKSLSESAPKRPKTMSVRETSKIEDCPIHIRGTVHNLGPIAPRGVLSVALHEKAPNFPTNQSGRLQIANWIASEKNPLTARVYVNRVWLWLMDEGLVRTADNFNKTGEEPTHPELLDYLALQFMEEGWSTKKLIRRIVSSATYQQASEVTNAIAEASDPENRLLWRMNRRRLEAECLRDAILAASGDLDLTVGGPNHPPALTADYGFQFNDTRRSVYTPAFRNVQPGLFEVFDAPNSGMVMGKRTASTVPTQALYLMNDPWIQKQAGYFANRIVAKPADQRITYAWQAALGRAPKKAERTLIEEHLATSTNELDSWTSLAQTLFACVDFRYID